MRQILLSWVLCFSILWAFVPASFAADETQFIRMPSTFSGLTGLLQTQSIDTLAPESLEVGSGGLILNEGDPDFSETILSFTAVMGISKNFEIAAQIPYVIETNISGEDQNDVGDIRLSAKWRFSNASPDLNLPGFGLSLSFVLPTGDLKTGTGSLDAWGLQLLLLSSAELELSLGGGSSTLVGVYGNGGIYWQDSGKATEESRSLVDLGLLIPLEETRQWQLLLEASARVDRQRFGQDSDYVALMPALRYVSDRFAVSGGWQRRFTETEKDADVLMGQASYLF